MEHGHPPGDQKESHVSQDPPSSLPDSPDWWHPTASQNVGSTTGICEKGTELSISPQRRFFSFIISYPYLLL